MKEVPKTEKKKKKKKREDSPCAAKSTRTSGRICCDILRKRRYDRFNAKCQSLVSKIFQFMPGEYILSFSASSCRSRGSSADEFSCRDWSLGEAFAWCLIWAPHSPSPADLWGHIGRLYLEQHTWFCLSGILKVIAAQWHRRKTHPPQGIPSRDSLGDGDTRP